LQELELSIAALAEDLVRIADEAAEAEATLSGLRTKGLTGDDRAKLQHLQTLLREQLHEYQFSSLAIGEINISDVKYTPDHEGFDLGFDLSASDMIRTIWAYLLSMLELARSDQTSHCGMLIFDEPRQQETATVSFVQLLRRASLSYAFGQQVIFATSEEEAQLRVALANVPHSFLSFSGKILSAER
jgi:hypothetical protein